MLVDGTNINFIRTSNNLTESPITNRISSSNKRGCCQSKKRNYNLISTSNQIYPNNKKTCCGGEVTKLNNQKIPKTNLGYLNSEIDLIKEIGIESFKEKINSKVSLKYNEFVEIYDKNVNSNFNNFTQDSIKVKLMNPNLKLDVISNTNETDKLIKVRIVNNQSKKKYLDLKFEIDDSNIEKYEESLSLLVLSRWISIQILYSKINNESKNEKRNKVQSNESIIPKEQCKNQYGIDSECMCINHDMGCSFWTDKGGNLQFWTLCVGTFEIDIFECCYKHDVGLWCTSNLIDATSLGFELFACIDSNIIKTYTNRASFLCELIEIPIIATKVLLFLIKLSPVIGAIMGIFGSGEYRNQDGNHDRSCLCGGDLPTVCCKGSGFTGVCRDKCCNEINLCGNKIDKKRGKNCKPGAKCGMKCSYSADQGYYNSDIEKLVPTTSLTISKQYYSKENPSKIIDESECCSIDKPDKCTDECFNCFYACKRDPITKKYGWGNGVIKVAPSSLYSYRKNLPCCEGTPNENLEDRSNYCPTHLNKSRKPCDIKKIIYGEPCTIYDDENEKKTKLKRGLVY